MTTGVLVMSYGTPNNADEIISFYTDIRRGRPPTEEQVENLRRRYEAIGGLSPLTERSLAQVRAIEEALTKSAPDQFAVFYATKHAKPSIHEVVQIIAESGIEKIVGLVLAPHYSPLSIGDYVNKMNEAAQHFGVDATCVTHWHDMAALIDLLSERVQQSISRFDDPSNVDVIFSAHSLPMVDSQKTEIYLKQLQQSADLVAEKIGIKRYSLGWQSAGARGGSPIPWLGPDITDQLRTIAANGSHSVVICPQGFTSDHLEILYDIDIVAAKTASELGITFVRTESLNDDPRLAEGLALRVIDHALSAWSS